MARLETRREREELARELETETGLAMARTIGRETGRPFATWADVAAFLHDRATPDAEKDAVLAAVGIAREELPHPLWNSVHLFLLFSGLVALHRAKRRWGEEGDDELWQDLVAEFLHSVRGFDVRRWPDRIAARLLGQTRKRLHRRCVPRWRARRAETTLSAGVLERTAAVDGGIDLDRLDLEDARQRELRELEAARGTGVIGEDDFHLLVGTCVYGRSSAEIARERGVSDQALRKRKQRARAAVTAWRNGR